MGRYIIQITSTPPTEDNYGTVIALTNDGNVYIGRIPENIGETFEWDTALPTVPQD